MKQLLAIFAIAFVVLTGPVACVDPIAQQPGNSVTIKPNEGGYTPNSNQGFGQPSYQNPGAGFPGSGFGSSFGGGD